MNVLRRIELVSGLAAGVFGVVGWVYALFAPAYHYVGMAVSSDGKTSSVSGATSLMQKGLTPIGIVFFVVVLLIVVSYAAGAYWHSQRGARPALMLLWALTALLWIAAALGAASIGVLLLPAALLAAVAAVAGSLASARTDTTGQS